MKQIWCALIAISLVLAPSLRAQPTKPAVATTLPAGWEEIDQRLVFFTVQLASVEASIDAVNKALKQAGYAQAVKQGKAEQFQKNNEMMDRQGGGPVGWKEFYGKTAQQFFFHPEEKLDVNIRVSQERHAEGSYTKMAYTEADRPPQFDYIYKANENAQARAEVDIAKLGGKIDALIERRRQLEAEQATIWAKMAFQAVASRKIGSKPIYRFELKIDGRGDEAKQRQDAARAGATFVRTVLAAITAAQDALSADPATAFDALRQTVAGASQKLSDQLVHAPKLALDVSDANTPVGRLVASAERMSDVTRNIAESYRSALDGDKAGDDQRKQTFRAFVQQALFDCATNITTTSEYMVALTRDWKAEIDVTKPLAFDAESSGRGEANINGIWFFKMAKGYEASYQISDDEVLHMIQHNRVKPERDGDQITLRWENGMTDRLTFVGNRVFFEYWDKGHDMSKEPDDFGIGHREGEAPPQKRVNRTAAAPDVAPVIDPEKPIIEDGWTILFRSDNPMLWNIAVRNKDSYAVPMASAGKFKYVRMRRMDTKDEVIIPVSRFGTPERPANHSYLREDKCVNRNGFCLGIVDMRAPADSGRVPVMDCTTAGNFSGWGFGFWGQGRERQGYLWEGEPIDPTVMEIAVTNRELTDAEQKALIKK